MVSKEVTRLKRQLNAKEKQLDRHKKEVEDHKKEAEKHKQKADDLRDEKQVLKRVIKKHTDTYMVEMKKALSTATLAAFAFLMALSWREYFAEVIESLMAYSPTQGKLVSAIFVTAISVIGIILVTRLLQVKEK